MYQWKMFLNFNENNYDNKKQILFRQRISRYVFRGSTVKTVAQKLNLSPRTVELYLDNIKNKLGCAKKSEVLEKIFDCGFLRIIRLF